jgi:hypothetical protein
MLYYYSCYIFKEFNEHRNTFTIKLDSLLFFSCQFLLLLPLLSGESHTLIGERRQPKIEATAAPWRANGRAHGRGRIAEGGSVTAERKGEVRLAIAEGGSPTRGARPDRRGRRSDRRAAGRGRTEWASWKGISQGRSPRRHPEGGPPKADCRGQQSMPTPAEGGHRLLL